MNVRYIVNLDEAARERYHEAEKIRVVLDNLSTHKAATLYEAFEPKLARAVLECLEFHYVPKHASWLNMVEIEIGVLARQYRRIPDRETLAREIAAWQHRRNAAGARVQWMFGIEQARAKLGKVYPQHPEMLANAA